jgi:two-component system cell cycle response regulator
MSCLRCASLERKLEERMRELRELALKDDLTGLYNRRGFLTTAEQYLRHARRANESALLFFFDIDGLKAVNDTRGHKAGDALIVETAVALQRSFRAEDIIARIGGDEFVALAIEASCSQAVLKRFGAEFSRAGVRFSYGFTAFDPKSDTTVEAMIERADAAMYMQKRERKAG